MPISVVIATRNEAANIEACISRVRWADEIILVDDLSTDGTVDIGRRLNATIIVNDSKGSFHVNKNLGLEHARCDWILSLDADELVDDTLSAEIKDVVRSQGGEILGFYVNRRNYFLGKWIRGCGWYPDRIIRLFRKGTTRWPLAIHDVPDIADKSRVGCLRGHLEHYSYRSMDQYVAKFSHYTTRLAQEQWEQGKRVSALTFPLYFFIKPLYWFVRKYFFLRGFRDGFRGFFICTSSAVTIFFMYAKLWALQQKLS